MALAVATAFTIGIIPVGPGLASDSDSPAADPDPRATASAKPNSGRYKGKVGTFARIVMKTTPKKIKRLDAGVQATCQRSSDGHIRGPVLVAMRSTKKIPVKRNGKFAAKGTDKNDVSWKISGKFVSRKKAKGSFQASKFNFVFNPFFPADGELCSGSGKWTVKLKR
ncbi:MAG: hypothetical protein KDB62_02685 [Solirubrobacterales bacterium]|nr:hypothetical protein [Solirubrobacterales bacterium]